VEESRIGIRSAAALYDHECCSENDRGRDDAGRHRVTLDSFGRAVSQRLKEYDGLRALAHHGEEGVQPERDTRNLAVLGVPRVCAR